MDANGSLRYTNVGFEAKRCKLMNASPPATAPRPQPQAKAAAAPAAEVPPMDDRGARRSGSGRAAAGDRGEWERDSQETLDPLTNALVDPDESVRARAQELIERAWAAQTEAR